MITLLVSAFLGGLILNLSPCIFPVISLKILSFSKMGEGHAFKHGLIYSIGLIVSFILLGLITGLASMYGKTILFGGWGLLFPSYNLLMGLILAGLGCLQLGIGPIIGRMLPKSGRISLFSQLNVKITEKLGKLKQNLPYLYSFFFGIMTTFIGSACCGPLLGAAMGAVFKLGFVPILLSFSAVGLGMALPYLVLSIIPKWTNYIPKSGKWLERLKKSTGWGLIISSLWFFYLWF